MSLFTPIRRWNFRRKAEVAAAVRSGETNFADACQTYELSREELTEWLIACGPTTDPRALSLEALKIRRQNSERPTVGGQDAGAAGDTAHQGARR